MEQNGDSPATKKDLAELEQRLKAHVEHIETKLLSAFYGWARTMEVRVRFSDERLTLLEERIGRLERNEH